MNNHSERLLRCCSFKYKARLAASKSEAQFDLKILRSSKFARDIDKTKIIVIKNFVILSICSFLQSRNRKIKRRLTLLKFPLGFLVSITSQSSRNKDSISAFIF